VSARIARFGSRAANAGMIHRVIGPPAASSSSSCSINFLAVASLRLACPDARRSALSGRRPQHEPSRATRLANPIAVADSPSKRSAETHFAETSTPASRPTSAAMNESARASRQSGALTTQDHEEIDIALLMIVASSLRPYRISCRGARRSVSLRSTRTYHGQAIFSRESHAMSLAPRSHAVKRRREAPRGLPSMRVPLTRSSRSRQVLDEIEVETLGLEAKVGWSRAPRAASARRTALELARHGAHVIAGSRNHSGSRRCASARERPTARSCRSSSTCGARPT